MKDPTMTTPRIRLRHTDVGTFEDRNSDGEMIGHRRITADFYGDRPAGHSTYYRRMGAEKWTLQCQG